MRLLVVSQYFWPENFRVNELVSELVARGHEVTVLTGVPNYPEGKVFEDYRRDPESFSSYSGAEVLRVPLRPRGQGKLQLVRNYWSFVFWGTLLGPWKLRGKPFDAIIFFEISPITSVLPALLLRRLKQAPLLLWVLDLWPETLAAVGIVRSPTILRLIGRLVSFIYRRCDLILAQSRGFVPNIERWSGDSSRIRYFPQWAEAIFDRDLADVECAPEVAPYRDTFNVMFAGNIGEAQDFPAILDAAECLREHNDIRWLVVGDGRAAQWVRAQIEARALQKRVVMLGRYPLERMPAIFRGANALLVSLRPDPIFAMTIPGKVQSYLAAGLPLLGMVDGEGAGVIQESGAGLVCGAGDGFGLARRVRQLADATAEERAAMGQRGKQYARREFDRATLVGRLEGWLGGPPRP
ncbi:MAG: glycosyltransferase family 4 protein [Deltaproteobacteria bacterium]|nr:glycosyltransferase family 4 protein [Deltaproteobacteria bacterium]